MLSVELPAELVIIIISYLPLTSITRLYRVNRQWHEFLDLNENSVYRNAAWREGWLINPQMLLEDLDQINDIRSSYSRRSVRNVSDWKGFCMFSNYDVASPDHIQVEDGKPFSVHGPGVRRLRFSPLHVTYQHHCHQMSDSATLHAVFIE